jgi:transposase
MAMGKRRARQEGLWVSTAELPAGPGHPFYRRLNEVLDAAGFDGFVEQRCERFYADVMGRPSLSPAFSTCWRAR